MFPVYPGTAPRIVPGRPEATVTACPFCGEPPQAITTNDTTGASVYMDENGHTWQDPNDSDGPVDDGNPDGSLLPVAQPNTFRTRA
jgi:hypothetical protein